MIEHPQISVAPSLMSVTALDRERDRDRRDRVRLSRNLPETARDLIRDRDGEREQIYANMSMLEDQEARSPHSWRGGMG